MLSYERSSFYQKILKEVTTSLSQALFTKIHMHFFMKNRFLYEMIIKEVTQCPPQALFRKQIYTITLIFLLQQLIFYKKEDIKEVTPFPPQALFSKTYMQKYIL